MISRETISRLVKDVKEMMVHPLSEHGIYYKHDEEDMLKGYALIIGPEDTPYHGGNYLFEFSFPVNYPFAPPTVTYCTNNGVIRFNPNLYTTGKVCISVLNTWRGEQWTSCQTISTILLSLSTLFCKSPLLNEPGCRTGHVDEKKYAQIVEYANVEVAVCDIVNKHAQRYNHVFDIFDEPIAQKFVANYEKVLSLVEQRLSEEGGGEAFTLSTIMYNMQVRINYTSLKEKLVLTKMMFSSFEQVLLEQSKEK